MSASLFQSCGVFGRVGAELTEGAVARVATAFGSWLRPAGRPRVLVGSDLRIGGPALRAAAINGLRDSGTQTVDVGQLAWPVLQFAERTLQADAAVYVTAGDRAAAYNGLRFSRAGWPLMPEDLAAVREMAGDELTLAGGGSVETATVPFEYQAWLLRTFAGKTASLKVVLDAGHGAWAGVAGRYLLQLGLTVVGLPANAPAVPDGYCDPFAPAAMARLSAAVIAEKADIGIALDADGDRMAAVDEAGRPLPAETTARLLFREALAGLIGAPETPLPADRPHERPWVLPPAPRRAPADAGSAAAALPEGDDMLVPRAAAAPVPTTPSSAPARPARLSAVADIRCGRATLEEIEARCAVPHLVRSGDVFLQHRVKAEDAVLGLSAVGHLHWRDLDGGADGLYAALRLIAAVSRSGAGLSALAATVKDDSASPEFRLPCLPADCDSVIRSLELTFGDEAEVNRLDGVRLEFESAWALARPSADQTALVLRFGGRTAEDLADVMELVGDQLPAAMAEAVRRAAAQSV